MTGSLFILAPPSTAAAPTTTPRGATSPVVTLLSGTVVTIRVAATLVGGRTWSLLGLGLWFLLGLLLRLLLRFGLWPGGRLRSRAVPDVGVLPAAIGMLLPTPILLATVDIAALVGIDIVGTTRSCYRRPSGSGSCRRRGPSPVGGVGHPVGIAATVVHVARRIVSPRPVASPITRAGSGSITVVPATMVATAIPSISGWAPPPPATAVAD